MENESEKHSRGTSGFGAPDYTSPAWRAGDLERQRLQQEKSNASGTSSSSGSLNVWAFIIAWLILFYLTYQVYVPLLEMVFGNDLKVSEAVKWLNVAIMMAPPTIIVYLFRRFIPALFAFSIIAGILTLAYFMITE